MKLAIGMVWLSSVLALVGCMTNEQERAIQNVAEERLITLNKNHGQHDIHSLQIKVVGDLDGEAELTLLLDGTLYRTNIIKDKVNLFWQGDWYEDAAVVHYRPRNVKQGHLDLQYEFKGL